MAESAAPSQKMIGRQGALFRSQCDSLRKISRDWIGVASSLEASEAAKSVRDLTYPPSVKKTMRTTGIALAVAPEPFTTAAGVALVTGSFAVGGEPANLESVAEELRSELSVISEFDLGELTISL
jgi:hypothetical protein